MQPVGSLNVLYPAGWYHPHSELVVQPSGDETFAVYLQIGSDKNFGDTVQTVRIQNGTGGTIAMAGDSIQRLSLSVANDALNVLNVTQIATGLRNAAGMAFEPTTGDLYIAENGIDGLVNANEPTSADELNVVAASQLGSEIVDFGFPQRYVEYRTGDIIGADQPGVDPLIAFQPLGDPLNGEEGEGPNQMAFLPDSFPTPLHGGIVVTMHGRFASGGLANEENPLVFVDANLSSYLHLISNQEPNVGHLDGVLSTADSLYIADVSISGGLGSGQARTGAIYQIKSRFPSIESLADAVRQGSSDNRFDVNSDQQVNAEDFNSLIHDIYQTSLGDANLDGHFDSSDLVQVLRGASTSWRQAMLLGPRAIGMAMARSAAMTWSPRSRPAATSQPPVPANPTPCQSRTGTGFSRHLRPSSQLKEKAEGRRQKAEGRRQKAEA